MAEPIHVTQQNLTQFQDYLLNLRQPDYSANLHFDLPLSVILRNVPTLNRAAQETLAYVIASGHGHENHVADVETMLDLAEKQPIMLGRAYQRGGNSTTYNDYVFSNINRALRNRPFEQNIPAIYALLHYSIVRATGTGEITKMSAKNTNYLNEIFRLSRENNNDLFHTNAGDFIRKLPTYKLLNFETKEPGFRDYIDEQNFGTYDHYDDKRDEMLERMNPDKISEKTLAVIIKSMTLGRPQHKDTTNAKTQAEKNVNILPMYYTKVRDALLRLTEKQEAHDRNNYGAIKSLGQRYQDLVVKLLGVKSWNDIDAYKKRGLIQEAYIIALQRDIIDGNAKKLSADELQTVLNNDKDGFFVRKIDKNLLTQLKLDLTPKQQAIIAAQNEQNAKYVINNKNLSSRDKRQILDSMEKSVAADTPERDALNAELTRYDQDYQNVTNTGHKYMNVSKAFSVIQKIQNAYRNITRNFTDGNPNNREASLESGALENLIYNRINGISHTPVAIPDQGGLPIFGRTKEKDRRERLSRAISDLNNTLSQIVDDTNSDVLAIISKYKGNILNSETLSSLMSLQNEASATANDTHSTFTSTHRRRDDIERNLKRLADKQQALVDAQSKFKEQQSNLHKLAKRHMGHDQMGELTPITDDMTPQKKSAARKKNRDTLKDKLAQRKNKKPARNMQELLQNADIDR